ncbi:MFS general substrate transporter [Lentinula aciculospora]|uniref:MFS general substrate transporter n=1 Tax=Lentinula aciculospora TaxID=153920 RepID=A0A9W8ZU22_9AGAR|nr:MFS general substrate transporter [Lentinula aciculospora]
MGSFNRLSIALSIESQYHPKVMTLAPHSSVSIPPPSAKILDVDDVEKFVSMRGYLSPIFPTTDDNLANEDFRAWVVLFGAMCISFTTSGYMSIWGVFQAHYEQNILKDSSPSSIAWIGSIQQSCLYIPTLIFTRLLDMGYFRIMLTSASFVFIASTFLVAQCHTYWQFLLCQGVLTGVTAGAFTGPVTAVLSQTFIRRRGLALGLYAAGSSMGGTILPIITRLLLPVIGFPWTMRVLASIIMFGLLLGNLTIKQQRSSSIVKGHLLDFSLRQSKIFLLYCSASFLIYLGYYTFTTYIAASAISVGAPLSFSFYLVSICNACSGLSRITSGFIADKLGAMNIMIPATCLSVIIYYIWPFASSQLGLIFLSILYGVSIGPFASLVSRPVLDLGRKDQLGQRVGILMSMVGISMLIGTPTSGAINTSQGSIAMGFFAGSMMLFGVILMAIVQYIFGKQYNSTAGV